MSTFFNGEPGKAKCEQVRAITSERLESKLDNLTEKEINAIEGKLVMILALEDYIERKIKERMN